MADNQDDRIAALEAKVQVLETVAPLLAGSGASMPTTPAGLTQRAPSSGRCNTCRPSNSKGLQADARTDVFAFGATMVVRHRSENRPMSPPLNANALRRPHCQSQCY